MHPLIARIHPAVRTAVFAWLLSRSALWLVAPNRSFEPGAHTPVPGLLMAGLEFAGALFSSEIATRLVAWTPWVAVEILMLFAGIAVYRFARNTDLPQVAERACWLWFFNPVVALTVMDWGAQMAAALGALALAGVVTHRPRRAAVATLLAVGCRLEFILLWPAIAIAGWIRHRPDKEPATMALVSTFTMPLAFSFWVVLSWHLAGAAHISLRGLHGETVWRTLEGLIPTSTAEIVLVVGTLAVLGLALRYLRRFPLWYGLCAVPALLWPLSHVPAQAAAISICWALPVFVYLAVASDDRAIERPLMISLVVAFLLAVPGQAIV